MFDVSKGPDYYLAQVRNTLAHELLHAKHHMDAYRTFHEDTTEAVRVKEALADFFAYYYTQNPETCCWGTAISDASVQVAADRLCSWEKKFGGSWPYAYALNIFPVDDGGRRTGLDDEYVVQCCTNKYMKVWGDSRGDMQKAYAALVTIR